MTKRHPILAQTLFHTIFLFLLISTAHAEKVCLNPDTHYPYFSICAHLLPGETQSQMQKFEIVGFSNYGITSYWSEKNETEFEDISLFHEYLKYGVFKKHFYFYHEPRRLSATELCELFGKDQFKQFQKFEADHSNGSSLKYTTYIPPVHHWGHNPHRPSLIKRVNNFIYWNYLHEYVRSKRLSSVSCLAKTDD